MTKERKKRTTKFNHDEVRALYLNGASSRELAEKYDTTQKYIRTICKGLRPGNQYQNGTFDRIANAKRYIDERTPGFEYAGNFTGIDGYADIKCKTCGTVTRKSFVAIRHGVARCQTCYKKEVEENKIHKEEANKRRLEKRKREKEERELKKQPIQLEFSVCKSCGNIYIKARSNNCYCSNECLRRTYNAISKDKRIKKMKAVVVDKGITLERLYKKEKGVCYLCGKQCDYNDYIIDSNGTFIAFGNYPSIDHVKPLSKGGAHSWDNVRLAHRDCNTKKSNRDTSLSA